MQGVHEVHPDSLETLYTEGMDTRFVAHGALHDPNMPGATASCDALAKNRGDMGLPSVAESS